MTNITIMVYAAIGAVIGGSIGIVIGFKIVEKIYDVRWRQVSNDEERADQKNKRQAREESI